MRYFKKTFIWIIVLTSIAGYYYIDLKREKIREKEKVEATRLLPFDPIQVLKIQLKKEESSIVLERWEEGWRITEPVKAPAVNEKVEEFLGYVTQFQNDSDYVMDADPTEERLKEFGLDQPENVVTLSVGRELKSHTIFFGHRAPTKGVAFARLQGDPQVYRVLADAKGQANQDVYYFRDKRVVEYDPVMVDLVEMVGPSGSIRCELPMNGKWEISEPIQARADITKIMEFLMAFKNNEIKEFVEEEPTDLVQYNLQPATRRISFGISGDLKPSIEILLGKRDKKKRGVFALLSGKKNVVLLDDKLLDFIPTEPFTLMNREIFLFEEEEVQKVRILSGRGGREFEKTPDYNWKQTIPEEAVADFNPIMAFLQAMRKVEIKRLLTGNPSLFEMSGLNNPAYKVMVWTKTSKEKEWLSIGNKAKEEGYYAMSGGGPDIFIIAGEVESEIRTFLGEGQ